MKFLTIRLDRKGNLVEEKVIVRGQEEQDLLMQSTSENSEIVYDVINDNETIFNLLREWHKKGGKDLDLKIGKLISSYTIVGVEKK